MPERLSFIRKVPLFNALPESLVRDMANFLRERKFRRGEYIFYEGDEGNQLFIIAEGLVKVTKLNEDGREKILSILGPGEFFGELSLFDGAPRSATIQAKSECKMYSLERKEFLNLLKQSPDVSLSVITVLASRLRAANSMIEDITFKDAREKLISLFMELALKYGKIIDGTTKVRLVHKFTHQELADMISASRETVSRIIGNLIDEGKVEISSDHHMLILLEDR